MTYVITGSTGFIGRTIIDYLLTNGQEVIAVSHSCSRVRAIWPSQPNLQIVECEMGKYRTLAKKIQRADVFVSLAWAGTTVEDRYSEELQTRNMQTTLEAMRAAKDMDCQLFVVSGSQAEYGIVDDVIGEETPCHPTMAYGQAKLNLLHEATKLSKTLNLPYLHLRIFSVFGNGDHPYTLIETTRKKMKNNEHVELSPCTQKWNFLYVKDMAYQIVTLCDVVINKRAEPGVYIMASDDTRELRLYMEEMKSVLHSESELCFGAIQPSRLVSLNPDTAKLKRAIGTLNKYTFEQALLDMNQ